jgi:hypothetical protein
LTNRSPTSEPAAEIGVEAVRLSEAAHAARLEMRLMGGLAVYVTSPSVRRPPYARTYADLDFAVSSRHARESAALLERSGYVPEKLFNALHGAQRLNFAHPAGRWTIDVVVDEIRMSHRIDLRGRLAGDGPTIPLADLLLTKLQIWEINAKDLGDVVCLLADHPIAPSDGGAEIDVRRVTALTGDDWGLERTIGRNLGRALEEAGRRPPVDAPFDPATQVDRLRTAIDTAPKSLRWRARARVGERVRWYETPEEVRH